MFTRYALARGGIALALLATITACGGPPPLNTPNAPAAEVTAAPQPDATVAPEATATAETPPAAETATAGKEAARQTPPAQTCEALSPDVAEVIRVEVKHTPTAVEDYVAGATREGCQLTATWTGAHLDDFTAVSRDLTALLADQGWTQDDRYAADGPTGTVIGFTRNDQIAILSVEWQPGPEVSCLADQPISECAMLPEQRHYSLALKVAARTTDAAATAVPGDS